MKKISCFIIVVISFFIGVTYCNSESCALTQSRNMSMGEKASISITDVSPILIHFPDGKGIVNITMSNIVTSGTYSVKEGYSYVDYPFSNDPNYNNLSITFVNIRLKDSTKQISLIPGQTSISFDVELSEVCDEHLSVAIKSLIYEGHVIENTTFDIEIQPTASWIPKSEEAQIEPDTTETDDEDITDTKTEAMGKICQQCYCYSNKCKIDLVLKDQRRVRVYRKSSPKGKYKLIKQTNRDDVLDDMTIIDKGLKPNKQYWYKIQTLDWDNNIWSKKSSAKSYWTAPEKVKVKRSGNTLRWNKVKGAVGYMVVEYWKTKVGYNIFWQVLTDYYEKSYLTKKRTYSFNHQIYGYEVYAIAKHNGHYYSNNEFSPIYKKMSSFKYSEEERHVG